jgi:flagellar biosynthesis/type III secretory pathway M-ring protein FliF/YscJ
VALVGSFRMNTENRPPEEPTDVRPGEGPAEADARESDGPVVDAQETKQGRSGLRIVVVLVVSITLILIIYAIMVMASQPGLDAAEDQAEGRPVPAELQPVPEASTGGSPAATPGTDQAPAQ